MVDGMPMPAKLKWVLGGVLSLGSCALLLTALTTQGCASFGGTASGARLQRMQQSPLYDVQAGTFVNKEPTEVGGSPSAMWEFVFGNGALIVPNCALPLFEQGSAVLARPPASGLRITWLGHSSTLVEIDGKRVLTDPMWSDRASPSSVVGPQRFHPPPIAFADLPPIDAVVVSHDHYDHLDMETIQALAQRGVVMHVPLGIGAHLDRWGVPPAQIVEHVWGQESDLGGGVRVISTPSRHFSGRGLLSRNSTLWTSWSLVGPQHRVFFSGDTGQTESFAGIGEKFGPFDVAMLEIGQWHPSWGSIHMGPDGALKAFQALGARRLLPVHWATFALGLHAWSEPAETLVTHGEPLGVHPLTPMLGQPVEPTQDPELPRWWRSLPPTTQVCPKALGLHAADG